ncbi:hypothetical protein ACWDTP_27575 [Mycobacterium sp. NPDC003449]
MLAAFGLDRLEASLTRDHRPAPTPSALPAATRAPAARPLPTLADRADAHLMVGSWVGGAEEERLPTRLYRPHDTNPEFRATRHANRV